MKHNIPKFERQSHTIVLFTILLLAKVFTFEIKAQSYQFLIGNPAITDTNTNYTLNAGLTRYYFDSLHAIDTSIHNFLPGEKAFKRYKFAMQDRIYSNGTQIGGDIFTSAEIGKQLLLQNIQPCANSDYPWTMVGPRNTEECLH